LEIKVRESDGISIVDLEGSLDTGTAPTVDSKLGELISGGATKILIILSAVDFVSSAGLRVLLATTKKLRKAGGNLRLCGLNETVQEVFEISGFNNLIEVFGDEAQAKKGF
jgi:anti-anti-sigma factor